MAFRFKRKEDFDSGFHRIAAEQIERALSEWRNTDRAIAVHETRKCMKRLRALLRLVRPAMTSQDYRKENAFLRDIGRVLATSRDRQVMLETIMLLRADAATEDAGILDVLQDHIVKGMNGAAEETAPNVKKTSKAIAEAGEQLAKLNLQASGFDIVAPGFERTYRRGRKAMANAISERANGTARLADEASHEWRKQVQAHWRQLSLLAASWPDFFETRITLARQLSDELGLDHDLAVLKEYAIGPAAEALGAERVSVLCGMIEARQHQLRQQALHDGKLLYADRPSGLSKRVRHYWDIVGQRPKCAVLPQRGTRLHAQEANSVPNSSTTATAPASAECREAQTPAAKKPARSPPATKRTRAKAAAKKKASAAGRQERTAKS